MEDILTYIYNTHLEFQDIINFSKTSELGYETANKYFLNKFKVDLETFEKCWCEECNNIDYISIEYFPKYCSKCINKHICEECACVVPDIHEEDICDCNEFDTFGKSCQGKWVCGKKYTYKNICFFHCNFCNSNSDEIGNKIFYQRYLNKFNWSDPLSRTYYNFDFACRNCYYNFDEEVQDQFKETETETYFLSAEEFAIRRRFD
jgi:hypothetical protein